MAIALTLMLLSQGSRPAAAQDSPPKDTKGDKPAATGQTNPDPHNVYSTGAIQEVFIDEDFKLYKLRLYQGIVPGKPIPELTDPAVSMEDKAPPTGPTMVERVGFEQRELFSRVFLLADRQISPWVYDNFVQAQADNKIPFRIYVEIAHAKVKRPNDLLPLITRNFNTPIDLVEASETKEGVRMTITLKRDARYLPVQVSNVIYIDVER
jgi:hypothetical protein